MAGRSKKPMVVSETGAGKNVLLSGGLNFSSTRPSPSYRSFSFPETAPTIQRCCSDAALLLSCKYTGTFVFRHSPTFYKEMCKSHFAASEKKVNI